MSERRKTLLVVDDDRMPKTLPVVHKCEYHVHRVATSEAALRTIEQFDLYLMLLNVRLPAINGCEVLKNTEGKDPYVEVIVIAPLKELDATIETSHYGARRHRNRQYGMQDPHLNS